MPIYKFTAVTLEGKNIQLADYRGKVMLIVNMGRKSKYVKHSYLLEKLNKDINDKNFIILGFICNQFDKTDFYSHKEDKMMKINDDDSYETIK